MIISLVHVGGCDETTSTFVGALYPKYAVVYSSSPVPDDVSKRHFTCCYVLSMSES